MSSHTIVYPVRLSRADCELLAELLLVAQMALLDLAQLMAASRPPSREPTVCAQFRTAASDAHTLRARLLCDAK
jgi:hypothetical protein